MDELMPKTAISLGWHPGVRLFRGLEVRRVGGALGATEYGLNDQRRHLFVLSDGQAHLLSADGRQLELRGRCIAWLPGEAGQRIRQHAGSNGILLSMPEAVLFHCLGSDLTSAQVLGLTHERQLIHDVDESTAEPLISHVQLIEHELYNNGPGAQIVLQRTIGVLLVLFWRACNLDQVRPQAVPRNLVNSFLTLLDTHLRDHWTVADYADHLDVSRSRLTNVVERATGLRPLQVIHNRLVNEAMMMLTTTDQHVAQIAFALGYSDPAYFGRFFRQQTGMTPARYRRQIEQADDEPGEMLAAWP